jgi:predicted TIM-barrel fold metal-dependent hydrolase
MWLAPPKEAKKDGAAAMQDQVEVMARISRRKTGVRVHGFVGFDPLRQALHVKQRSPPSQSPLALVQRAIETKGFIGVKLYPPMGFRPIGNAELKEAFPPYVVSTPTGLGKDAGKLLDNALLSLFVWCRDNNVPVMAHARNSNEPYPKYGERANPELWGRLLRTKDAGGKDFSSLHINLAHFGGFEEAFEEENSMQETWEWANGKLWSDFPHSPVFADISYFNDVLPLVFRRNPNDPARAAHAARLEKIKEFLASFRERFPTSGKHLIFGTDWTMVGNAEGFPELGRPISNKRYTDRVCEFLTEAGYGPDIDDILFNNAVRFLGLGPEGRERGTRGRLERFYASAGLNADWLRQFG